MHSDGAGQIVVFDMGGTWFRWGLFDASHGLIEARRASAINYLSHPDLSAAQLQSALVDFIIRRTDEIRSGTRYALRSACVSLGAPINAHDMTVLGSGPLWGATALPFHLRACLTQRLSEVEWLVLNDITALLAPYMDDHSCGKTLLVTVSSGIGSRLYDHRERRIPYDSKHGVQGEIGHLVVSFELAGSLINRRCECGGWNHMNAFASGRGIAQTLRELPKLVADFGSLFDDSPEYWQMSSDEHHLSAFRAQLDRGNPGVGSLLDAFVTPLARILAGALAMDPDIDRIVITGGVAHGLGPHYRGALQRTFLRDGLYQITERDPQYLSQRLHWSEADDFAGLYGAGIYAARLREQQAPQAPGLAARSAVSLSGTTITTSRN
jgi:glucokinase